MVQSYNLDIYNISWGPYIHIHKYEEAKRPTIAEFTCTDGSAIPSPTDFDCWWVNIFKVIEITKAINSFWLKFILNY